MNTYFYSLHINYLYLHMCTHENLTYLEYDNWGSSRKITNKFVY